MTFSEKLRYLIEEKGITQKQLAAELKIAVSTMGGYVQGNSEPDFAMLRALADYFDTTTDYLLGRNAAGALTAAEDELLRVYRTMPPSARELYLEEGRAIAQYLSRRESRG